MARGSTAEPTGGVPSLTTDELIAIYQEYGHRAPDAGELSSDSANAMKYSAAGIERGIAQRFSNVAGSGVRGDEGLPSLTVPAPLVIPQSQIGNVITMGAAAIQPGLSQSGPTGLNVGTYGQPAGGGYYPSYAAGAGSGLPFGLTPMTLLLLAGVAGGAWYFLVRK